MAQVIEHLRRRLRAERGAELVEMAVILPLLLILIAGIVDFGFLLHSFAVVTNGAREGARIAVLPGYNDADIEGRVASYVTSAGVGNNQTTCSPTSTPLACTVSDVSINPGGGGAAFPAKQVSVSYTHQYLFIQPMMTLIGRTFSTTKTFTTTSVMRVEVAP